MVNSQSTMFMVEIHTLVFNLLTRALVIFCWGVMDADAPLAETEYGELCTTAVDDAAMLSADRGTVIAGLCLACLPGYLPAC